MSNFYQNPTAAWRWVLVLHKLASLDIGRPLKLAPTSSIHTARAKLYGGRQYLEATSNPALAKYQTASLHTRIAKVEDHLTITADDSFHEAFSCIPADEFVRALRFISAVPPTGGTYYPEAPLSHPQTAVLKEYLSGKWLTVITPNMVSLSK